MVIAKIIVDRTSIRIASKHKIPKGIIGGKVQIEYADSAWDGLMKTAVFQGCTTKDVIDIDTEVTIPHEVVADSGVMLFMGLYGVDADNNIAVPTMWIPLGMVQNAADPSGDTSTDPTLPVWAQLEQKYETLLYLADNPQYLTAVADWQAAPMEPGHILNRTHWAESVNVDIFFDGDITGHEIIEVDDGMYLVKMSDQVLSVDDLIGSTVTIFIKGEDPEEGTIELTADNVFDGSSEGVPILMAGEALWCVQSDFTTNGISMEAGVYFLCVSIDGVPYAYVKSASCLNAMNEVVHKLDNKFLDMEWCANVKANGIEVILPEKEQLFSGTAAKQYFIFSIEPNKTYGVHWNGDFYRCPSVMVGTAFYHVVYIGNGHLYSEDLPDTEEPFCVFSVSLFDVLVTTRIFAAESATSYIVGIDLIENVNNRIPYEFLPKVYVMPTDIGLSGVQMDELAEAHNILQLGGKVYARYNNSTYQVLQAYRDFIDDQYDSMCMVSGGNFYMWGKKRGWTGFSTNDFTITTNSYYINESEVQGKKFKFTVDETGTLTATDVTDTLE